MGEFYRPGFFNQITRDIVCLKIRGDVEQLEMIGIAVYHMIDIRSIARTPRPH